ncbi:right-handed parallel beta-helix repeat-containing protein [Bacillus wiedmannii]|uniref:right-handed parallel beta-helix repeat-containing protein n=1 Tax=Bacillus wiedmannii TaxID=1890302 RepID=UPI0021D0A4AE|nr:right-handed parallel beta-helix repeat-containing protein [Bacillus wiedmannii]MCU5095060.1 right-handed parallel beta-helix repeat-containing protein [Bacillus wiedmannii]
MDDAPKLQENEFLDESYYKINMGIDNANEALKKSFKAEENSNDSINISNNAVNIANKAEITATSVQSQLDTIVINKGQSDAEVLQARTDKDGKTYATLKSMNDAQQNKIEILLDNVVYIESFPFKQGDTSDSERIQRAIDLAVGGKVLGKSKSEYILDKAIVVPPNIEIDFDGSKVIRKKGTTPFDMIINKDIYTGNDKIKIKNVVIDGNKDVDNLVPTTVSHRFSGLKFQNVKNSELHNITVIRTVNGEEQGNNESLRPAAGIYFYLCTDVTCTNLNGWNNDRTAIFVNKSRVTIDSSLTFDNQGSGISSTECDESKYSKITSFNNGYTNVSVNGKKCFVDTVLSYGSKYSGVAVGHSTSTSDESVVSNIISYNNEYEGLTIGGSLKVQLNNVVVYGNKRDNIRVFDGASGCQFLNILSRDSVGNGMRIYSGVGHVIDNSDFYKNGIHGIYVDAGVSVKIGDKVKVYNNGQFSPGSVGILLSQAINCEIGRVECYDDQSVKTQDAGLWISGGSGHTINLPDLHDNISAPVKKSSSPLNLKESYRFPTAIDYISITPINGWTGTATRYTKSADNIVRLEGEVNGSSSTSQVAINMPVGLRPNSTLKFPVVANGSFAEVQISSNGNITIMGGIKTTVSLCNIIYKAVQ